MSADTEQPVKHRIGMAIVCLHISAVLYVLIGVLFLVFLLYEEGTEAAVIGGTCLLSFCLVLVVGIEFVVARIKRRKFWAWVAGLCIFGV